MTIDTAPRTVPRKRQETLRRLLAAAEDILESSGPSAVSIGSVCARAGYTRGAFYSNFSSVDDLFLALLESQHERVIENLDSVIAGIPAGGSRAGAEQTIELVLEALPLEPHRIFVLDRVVSMALTDPEVAERYQALMAAMLARLGDLITATLGAHALEPTTAPERLAGALMALISGELRLSIGTPRAAFLERARISATALVMQLSRPRR